MSGALRGQGQGGAIHIKSSVRVVALIIAAVAVLAPWGANSLRVADAAGGSVVGVASNSGVVTLEKSASWRELVVPETLRNVNLRFDVATDKIATGAGQSISLVARRVPGVGEYRVRLRLRSDGRIVAVVIRRGHGQRQVLGRHVVRGISHRANAFISVRVTVKGTSPTVVRVRAWAAEKAEPSKWSLRVRDRRSQLSSAGQVALRFALSSSNTVVPVNYEYQGLVVKEPAAAPDPTPTPSATPSNAPTTAPTATPKPSTTPTPAPTSTPAPSSSPTPAPSATPTPAPSSTPTPAPTATPTPSLPADAIYVAPNGSDSGAGTKSSPWKTLQKAANNVAAGSTVVLRGGTYDGFRLRKSGTAAKPITFMAYPGEKPVIDGRDVTDYVVRLSSVSHVELVGLTVRGGFMERQAGGGVLVEDSSHVVVRDSVVRDNSAFGIRTYNSTYVRIEDNDIFGNAVGVRVNNAGEGIVIKDNLIHENDRMMINNQDVPGDDVGADAIELVGSTGHVLVKGNYIWGNRAPSYDFGYDGGAFAIHAASNWTITQNVTWDNRNVLETGTDPTRGGCENGVFTRNLNYAATTVDRTVGMVLRCGENMLVANNTFHGMQYFVFAMSHEKGSWGSSVAGMRVVNNVISVSTGKVFLHENALPDSVVIDHNVVNVSGNAVLAQVSGKGNTNSMATYRSWTGQQLHGVLADPQFVNEGAYDFGLRADSPAVDAGMSVSGVTDGFLGSAPDAGYSERR